jgi:hypothetical protein
MKTTKRVAISLAKVDNDKGHCKENTKMRKMITLQAAFATRGLD